MHGKKLGKFLHSDSKLGLCLLNKIYPMLLHYAFTFNYKYTHFYNSLHLVCNVPFFPLDVLFEEDASVMPLMSAAKVWSNLENTTEDESLFKNITILLIVQVIT